MSLSDQDGNLEVELHVGRIKLNEHGLHFPFNLVIRTNKLGAVGSHHNFIVEKAE